MNRPQQAINDSISHAGYDHARFAIGRNHEPGAAVLSLYMSLPVRDAA